MVRNEDFDVKEYFPKKRRKTQSFDDSVTLPEHTETAKAEMAISANGVIEPGGGVMLTASEMLDFSEGADSYG